MKNPMFLITYFIFLPIFAYEDGEKVKVGSPAIDLIFRDPDKFESGSSFIGQAPTNKGDEGAVYNLSAKEVIKIIPANALNGNEVPAMQIAAQLDFAPKFFDAWVTEKDGKLFAVIKMERVASNPLNLHIAQSVQDKGNKELESLQKLFTSEPNGKTYFFDRLFTILKGLIDHKISYDDIKYGNMMMPPAFFLDLLLIDYGSARFYDTKEEAAKSFLASPKVQVWLKFFDNIADASKGKVAKENLEYIRTLGKEEAKEN